MYVMMMTALLIGAGENPKLAEAGWLTGSWKNDPAEKMVFEEQWTAAGHGSMCGTFKLVSGGKPVIYEFLMIEEADSGTWMRLRHYGPGMVDKDEKPARLKLTEANERKLVWSNPDSDKPKRIVYERDGEQLKVVVETIRGDKPTPFTLKFVRAGAK